LRIIFAKKGNGSKLILKRDFLPKAESYKLKLFSKKCLTTTICPRVSSLQL
jgi:hypothetical protein